MGFCLYLSTCGSPKRKLGKGSVSMIKNPFLVYQRPPFRRISRERISDYTSRSSPNTWASPSPLPLPPPPSPPSIDGCTAFISLDVFPFPPSSALPAVASWHGLSRARTSKDVLLLEQQRPRRRAAPLCLGDTVDLHEWWWRRSDTFWWNHRWRRASPWQSTHDRR